MLKKLSLVFLLSLLPLCGYSEESYQITETQLTKLETTIANQKISIGKQAILLSSSNQKILKLRDLTNLSEQIIKQQKIYLNKLETKSWTDKLYNFFIGLLTGSCLVTIIYLVNI